MARAATTTSASSNSSLHAAKAAKNDEFYTQLTDIEKELQHYRPHLKDKVVFCNCDDPEWSNFWKFFTLNFDHLQLKKVVTTHYANGAPSYKLEFLGKDKPPVKTPLRGDGDFRSEECQAILADVDVVVTNPPFSLFRDYVAQLIESGKAFLVIGNKNALTYREVFRLIKSNRMWLGITAPKEFSQPDGNLKSFGNIGWFTNLPHKRRNEELISYQKLAGNEERYPRYENFDGIEVSQLKVLPCDYEGCMGVPITFLDKYNPDQFEILGLGIATSGLEAGVQPYKPEHKLYRKTVQKRGAVDGDLYYMNGSEVVVPYARILIKRKSA